MKQESTGSVERVVQQMHARLSDDLALRECERRALLFMAHFDTQEYQEAANLFALEGVWNRADGVINGRADFMRRMEARSPGIFVRHVITNMRAKRLNETEIRVDSYVTVYRHDFTGSIMVPASLSAPDVMGRYSDVFRMIEGEWLLYEKSVVVDFKR